MKRLFNKMFLGKGVRSFLPLVMLIVCSILGTTDAWADSSADYYAKAKAEAKPSAAGTVYVKTGNKAYSTSTQTGSVKSETSPATVNFTLKADTKSGYKFKGWSTEDSWPGSFTQTTEDGQQVSVSSNATKEKDASTTTYYGYFVKVFQFKAKADFVTGSEGWGKVAFSFATGTPDYQAAAVTQTTTEEGSSDTDDAGKTQTAHFYAQPNKGVKFKGWYSDADGTNLVSPKESYSEDITSSAIAEPSDPQVHLYAKFEKEAVDPTWNLYGVFGTSKTLEIGETIKLVTETAGNSYSWGTPSYVDAGETNPVMTYDPATKTFTANRAGTVTVRFTQTAGEDANGVLWKAGSQTFTFTVEKRTPKFAWANPLPHFTVGTTLPVSELFSFTPAEAEQNWTLTSSSTTSIANIAAPATELVLSKEADGVTLTFHQPATWEWKEIENTSIKINVTKEPVTFNWKNPSLIAGKTYSWSDFVETNSEGAWNLMSDDESVIPTMRSIANTSVQVAAGTVTLSFTQGKDQDHDAVSIQTKTFTVYPSNGIATYSVNGTTYSDLQSAINAANGSTKYNIIVASDGVVLPGNYTIPVGVTLVVPYESSGTKAITAPQNEESVLTKQAFGIQPFRTLTLVDGVNITVNGAISVTAELQSADASNNPTGFPVRNTGVIDMSKGGHIDVASGGTLYAWGFIRGQGYLDGNNTQNVGTITAKSGSTIKECYGVGDWNGGTYTMAVYNGRATYRIYPFQSYFVQNVEVPLRIEYGARDLLYTNVYGGDQQNAISDIKFIGDQEGSLFLITDADGAVTKWYDATTDHLVVELEGSSELDNLQMTISAGVSVNINANEYDLPILSNMHIKLKNCNLTLTSPLVLQPGSIFEVTKGSSLTLSTNLFVYDSDEWGPFIQKKYFWPLPTIPTPKVNRGNGATNTLDDAKLIVDGTLTIASGGALYTTATGGNVMGNNEGSITWNRTLPSNKNVYGYTNGNSVNDAPGGLFGAIPHMGSTFKTEFIQENSCPAGWMHNDNDSYTAPIGNGTFKNIYGRWFKSADAVELGDHTYKFTYIDGVNTAATTFCVYTSDKTGLSAGYKWMNVALDNDFCGGKTFLGKDGNYYYYDEASKDAVTKWVQLVKLSDALYSGSDNNLYTFVSERCAWASVGEIGEDCMYTVDDEKMALVGTEFVALQKDEYDEVFVDASGHYYMLFDGCVWQHATKIPDTYKAYEVLGNPYIWMGEEWVEVAADGAYFYTVDDQGIKHFYEFDNVTFTWVPVRNKVRITTPTGDKRDFLTFDDAISYLSQYNDPTVTLLEDAVTTKSNTIIPSNKTSQVIIDLNGHTVSGNTAQIIAFNSVGKTLTITDNSDKQNGQIRTVYQANATDGTGYAINLIAGTLNWEEGSLYAHNTWAGETGYDKARSGGVYVAGTAGNVFNLRSGTIETHSNKTYAYSVYNLANSVFNMSGGKVKSHASTTTSYAVLDYGTMNMSGGEVEAIADRTTSYGVYVNAANAVLNMTGGSVSAESKANHLTAAGDANAYAVVVNNATSRATFTNATINALVSNYVYGQNARGIHIAAGGQVTVNSGTTVAATAGANNSYSILGDASATARSIITINGGRMESYARSGANGVYSKGDVIFNDGEILAETKSLGGQPGAATAYGFMLVATAGADGNNACGALTTAGGTVTVKTATTSAHGIYTNWGTVDKTDKSGRLVAYATANNVRNTTFNISTGTDTGYGIFCIGEANVQSCTFNIKTGTSTAYGAFAEGTTSKYGVERGGVITLANNVFNIETATSTAYGAYARAQQQVVTSTADGYYAGDYVGAGKLIINSGEFNIITETSTAYGVYVGPTVISTNKTASGTPSATVTGGTFNVTAKTTLACGVLFDKILDGKVDSDVPTRILTGGTFNIDAKQLTATSAGDASAWGVKVEAGNDITISGITVDVKSSNPSYGQYAKGILTLGKVTLENNTINAFANQYSYGMWVEKTTGNAIVNSGTYTAKANTGARGMLTYKDLVINGGTIIGQTIKTTDAQGIYSGNGTGVTTVNAGTIQAIATTTGAIAINCQNAADVAILKGGFYRAEQGSGTPTMINSTSTSASTAITGGHFSLAPAAKYVKAPYYVFDCVEDEYKKTYPKEVGEAYTITFKREGEDAALWTGLQPAGKMAVYPLTNGMPEKTATSTNSFEFDHWTPSLAEVTGEATYTASFNSVAKKFMVTWLDENGVEIDHKEYASGATPAHAIPEKTGYTFAGWTPAISAVVDEEQTYRATFTINKYTITWLDEDGSQIKKETMDYGTTLTPPTAEKDGYSFMGWSPAVVKVTGDATYQASYLLNVASVTTSAGVVSYFTALTPAVTAANANAGCTLTILQDLYGQSSQSLTKSMTVDLNGHVLAGAVTKLLNINAAGINIRMIDSKGNGQLRVSAAPKSELDAVYVTKGTFTLESGIIYCENINATANDSYRGVGVYVAAGMDFVMTGGHVEGYNLQSNYAIYAMGRATISGGEVVSSARTKARGLYLAENSTIDNVDVLATVTADNAVAVMVSNTKTPTVTINGGHFKAVAATSNACALNPYNTNTINVNGGVFEAEAPTEAYGIKFQVNTATVNFINGKIKATTAPVDNVAPASLMKFTNGFFNTNGNIDQYVGTRKVVALNPSLNAVELAEGYNYKIVDAAYQVTFKAEDGAVLQQANIEAGVQPVYVGEAQTKPSTPKYAYDFDGWMDASDSHVYTEAELPAASKDVVYTAHFVQRAVEYPITFSNIDGKGTDYVQMVAYGEEINYDGPTPYMSGAVSNYAYTFIGWSPELAVVDGPASYSPRYDLVISHNVSFVTGNASATTPTTLVVAEGAAVERPADQLVDCQHIVGWYKDAGLNEEWNFASDKLGDADLILYAKWATKTYTITWLDEFGDEIDQTVVNCGAVPTHADLYKPSTAAYSYEWKGWNKTIAAANADATYKSLGFNQIAKRYEIIFNTNGGSAIAPIQQEVGSDITAPADPTREGYTFDHWEPAVPTTMPAEDVTITASWTPNANTAYVVKHYKQNLAGDGYDLVDTDNLTGTTASQVTPDRKSYEGFTAPAGKNVTIAANGSTVVEYQYTRNSYTLTWISGGDPLTGSYTSGSVKYGTTIVAPNDPTRTGYTFGAWDRAIPATMPAEDVTIAAQWRANQFNIYFYLDEEMTELYQSSSQQSGETILPPTPDPIRTGYNFIRWKNMPSTMPGSDVYCIAIWEAIPSVAEVIPAGGGEGTPYAMWAEAVAAANASAGCTLRLLEDITDLAASSVLTNTLTLDLNGHELSGTVNKLININKSGKTVTITDNSEEKAGLIATQVDGNARYYCVYLTAGTLNIEGGTIRATNAYAYNSSSATKTQASAVYVATKYTCNISGGRLEAYSTYYPAALYVAAATTSTGKAYITGGELYAESTQAGEPNGIYTLGTVEMSGGTVTALSKTTNARGAQAAGSSSKYAGTFTITGGTINAYSTTTGATGVYATVANSEGVSYAGEVNIQGGEITATAGTTSAYGVYVSFAGTGAANTTADPKYYYYSLVGRARGNISGGTITAKTAAVNGSSPATSCYGVYSLGETEITGGTITARPTTTTAYGVYSGDGTMRISGNPTILAEATTIAYGAYAGNYYPGTFKLGYMGQGNLIIDSGDITARTTSTTKAYGLYVAAVSKKIIKTDSGYYPNETPYVRYGSATVNGGTITAIAETSTASAIYTEAPATGIVAAKNTAEAISESETVEPVVNINGGKFKAFTNLTTAATCLTVTGTNNSVSLSGGYYGLNTNLAAYAATPYHVFDNEGADKATYPYEVAEAYKVTFKNGTNVLQEGLVKKGATPSYDGTPTKSADAQYTYTFSTWSPAIAAVSNDNQVYTAQFNSALRSYTIIWQDEDGTELSREDINYGITPTHDALTKDADAQYTYSWKGWNNEVVAVSGPATYKSLGFTSTLRSYTIIWQDEDGTELSREDVNYGITPTHDALTKDADAQYTYSWKGWDNEVVAVSGPATYKSLGFTATPKSYTLTWNLNGGDITTPGTAAGSVAYNTALTAPVVEKTGYTFDRWEPAVPGTMPAANATYAAQWTANQYTITFNSNGGTSIDPINGNYGDPISAPADPEKTGYTFNGWNAEIPSTMPVENMEINATWTPVEYTITYEGLEGASNSNPTSYTIESETINFVAPGERTGYTFNGWSPASIATGSTGNKIVTASWTKNSQTMEHLEAGDGDHETPNETVNIDVETNTTNMTVHADGVVNMDADINVSGDLILEATETTSAEIHPNEGTLSVSGNVYFDLKLNIKARQWYAVAVPWQVDAATGISIKGVKTLSLGVDEDVTYYDGAARALYGSVTAQTVKYLEDEDDKTMYPGKMYFLYFARDWNGATLRFTKKSDAEVLFSGNVDVAIYNNGGSAKTDDSNWNGLANPTVFKALLDAGVQDGFTFNADAQSYQLVENMSEVPFVVGRPVMVQAEKAGSLGIGAGFNASVSAPARVKTATDQIVRATVTLSENDKTTDRIVVKAEEDKADSYVIGADLAKPGISTRVAQMWVNRYGSSLAVNTEAPDQNGLTEYPLVLQTTHAGDYVLATENVSDDAQLYLMYQGRLMWNLSMSACTLSLPQGKTSDYSLCLIRSKAPSTPTELETILQGGTPTEKVLIRGILYVRHGQSVFDAQGHRINVLNK